MVEEDSIFKSIRSSQFPVQCLNTPTSTTTKLKAVRSGIIFFFLDGRATHLFTTRQGHFNTDARVQRTRPPTLAERGSFYATIDADKTDGNWLPFFRVFVQKDLSHSSSLCGTWAMAVAEWKVSESVCQRLYTPCRVEKPKARPPVVSWAAMAEDALMKPEIFTDARKRRGKGRHRSASGLASRVSSYEASGASLGVDSSGHRTVESDSSDAAPLILACRVFLDTSTTALRCFVSQAGVVSEHKLKKLNKPALLFSYSHRIPSLATHSHSTGSRGTSTRSPATLSEDPLSVEGTAALSSKSPSLISLAVPSRQSLLIF